MDTCCGRRLPYPQWYKMLPVATNSLVGGRGTGTGLEYQVLTRRAGTLAGPSRGYGNILVG